MANRPLEHDTQIQDAATPLNSAGSPYQKYQNAAGGFDFPNAYEKRKVKSRKDLSQPKGRPDKDLPDMTVPNPKYAEEGPMKAPGGDDNATDRYFGAFSIEAKRNVQDLLKTHPLFGDEGKMRLNRVKNNTREVLPNDPTKISEVGGSIAYLDLPQASQPTYD
jgi:hypothetical protein